MKVLLYPAVIVPNDGKFSVFFPDLLGCLPWSDTFEEALANVLDALNAYLEMLADEGDPIPAPSSRDKAWADYEAECAAGGESVPQGTVLQLLPVNELSEQPMRVNVSFKCYMLDMIDRKAESADMIRSGFFAAAARSYEVQENG